MTTTTAPTAAREIMLDKVRKLFAKADSVAGTPEADTFNAKAFELLAKYGIDEADARQRAGDGPADIEIVDFDFSGKYPKLQMILLSGLAEGVGAQLVIFNSRTIVFGTASHIDRIRILFAMLQPQMLAGARKVRPAPGDLTGVIAYRQSWMRGFAAKVRDRLVEATRAATAEASAGTALALVDDSKRVRKTLRDFAVGQGATVGQARMKNRHSSAAAAAGAQAGSRVDIGQTGIRGSRALPAGR